MAHIDMQDITGLVLAGGRGSRMGGVDKGLQNHHGQPLALHALMRLRLQVGVAMINANRNLAAYASMGVPVWPDASADFPGPQAGQRADIRVGAVAERLEAECAVAIQIAICTQQQRADLAGEALRHALYQRLAVEFEQALVDAAQATAASAGQDQAGDGGRRQLELGAGCKVTGHEPTRYPFALSSRAAGRRQAHACVITALHDHGPSYPRRPLSPVPAAGTAHAGKDSRPGPG
jgi:molybdopterin-guanine dinucleotide biosynthesis protein A